MTHLKSFHLFTLVTGLLFMLACSDDDDKRPLTAVSGTSFYDSLNTCSFSSGDPGTRFEFQINLEAPPSMTLGGVEFDLEWSDGDESEDIFEEDLIITGSVVTFDWCFRFGSTDWFEVRPTIVDSDGKALSNTVTIRVNKPFGANFGPSAAEPPVN